MKSAIEPNRHYLSRKVILPIFAEKRTQILDILCHAQKLDTDKVSLVDMGSSMAVDFGLQIDSDLSRST